jgi:PAS domain S-box-containing protein
LRGVPKPQLHTAPRLQAAPDLDDLRFATLAELTPGCVHDYAVTADGDFILKRTHGAERVFGVSNAELQTRTANSFQVDDDADAIRERKARYLRGESLDFTTRIRRDDGELRWLRVSNRPVVDPKSGRVVRMIGFCTDITEENAAAAALRESEFRYRTVAELTPGFVYEASVDDAGNLEIVWASPSAPDFFGCSIEEFNRRGWRSFIPPYAIQGRLERRSRIMRGESTFEEIEVQTARGDLRWVELKTQPLRSPDGRIRAYLGIANDITEKRASEELLRSQAFAFEKMRDGIVLATETGIIRLCNPAFARLLGVTPAEVVGQTLTDLPIEPPLSLGMLELDGLARSSGTPVPRQLRLPERQRAVQLTVSTIRLRGERFWLVVLRDVTERQQLEREVLEIINREQQRIGSDLHDGLGQELTGIALLLRGLANRAEKQCPPLTGPIEEIARLVNDAIFTTRTLARGLTPVTFDRGGLAHALADLARRSQDTYGVRVNCTADPEVQDRLSDSAAMHLYRLSQEGIANAARHAEARDIDLGLTRIGDVGCLMIVDDGNGIAPGSTEHGMGLRIMRYRASMIDGVLEVSSTPGRGTKITCEFPLAKHDDAPVVSLVDAPKAS